MLRYDPPQESIEVTNAVEEAVYLVFGGVEESAKALKLTPQAIDRVLRVGFIGTKSKAERWEIATEKAGCRVPAAELQALRGIVWGGPGRHNGKATRKGSKDGNVKTNRYESDSSHNPAQVSLGVRQRLVGSTAANG